MSVPISARPTKESFNMAQIKKISVATIFGAITDAMLALILQGQKIHVMRVWGVAVGVKKGISNYGEWVALVGDFKALNPTTPDTVQRASQCFLPEIALLPVQVALEQSGNQSATFGMDVFITRALNPKPGGSVYEYTFEPLVAASADNPLARLEAEIGKTLALQHAPAAAPAPAPAPAAEPTKGAAKGRK